MMLKLELAQSLFNTPVALNEGQAHLLAALVESQGMGAALQQALYDDGDVVQPSARRGDAGYDMLGDCALIQATGLLVHKSGMLRPCWGICGYDGLRQAFLTAQHDAAVERIAVLYNSPGGAVSGVFDLADTMFETRGVKPVWAILDESAQSSAYALASAADKVIVPRTGAVGSIGVYIMHVDVSEALAKAGIKVTFVKKGELKVDGKSEIPLTDRAIADMQAAVNKSGALFDELVARNRRIAVERVTGFEGVSFMGEDGVAAGLADAVMSPAAAFQALLAEPV